MPIGGILILLIISVAVTFPIAAVILRASINLANRFLGVFPTPPRTRPSSGASSEDSPYETPQDSGAQSVVTTPIVEPTFNKAYVLAAVQGVLGFAVGFVISFTAANLFGERAILYSQITGICVATPVYAIALAEILPTSFRRGLLIAVLQTVILLGIITLMFLTVIPAVSIS